MPKKTIMSYADDTVVISSDNAWTSAQDKMKKYLEHVADWLASNKLSSNVNKTVYMTFGLYRNSVPKDLSIKFVEGADIKRTKAC